MTLDSWVIAAVAAGCERVSGGSAIAGDDPEEL